MASEQKDKVPNKLIKLKRDSNLVFFPQNTTESNDFSNRSQDLFPNLPQRVDNSLDISLDEDGDGRLVIDVKPKEEKEQLAPAKQQDRVPISSLAARRITCEPHRTPVAKTPSFWACVCLAL